MAEECKKSFILYLDSYDSVMALEPKQRGFLLTALFDYAREAAGGTVPRPQSILDRHPELLPETRMAFLFMAGMIQRDTERWSRKRGAYQEAAKRRAQERSAQQQLRSEGQDLAWMRKHIRYDEIEKLGEEQ